MSFLGLRRLGSMGDIHLHAGVDPLAGYVDAWEHLVVRWSMES